MRLQPRGKGPTNDQLRARDWLRLSDHGWPAAEIANRCGVPEPIVAAKVAKLRRERAARPEPSELPAELATFVAGLVPHFPVPSFVRRVRSWEPAPPLASPRDCVPRSPVTPIAPEKPRGRIVEKAQECPHRGPYPAHSVLCCMICHAEARDQHNGPLQPAA